MNRSTQTYSVSKLTPVQLQQRLIYTQAELAKYKQQLDRYQNDYHYSLIDQLHLENKELKEQVQLQQVKAEELDQLKQKANEYTDEINLLKAELIQYKKVKSELEEQVLLQQSKAEELYQFKLEATEQAIEVNQLKEKIIQMETSHKEDIDNLNKQLDKLKKSQMAEQNKLSPHQDEEGSSQKLPNHVPPEKSWFHRSLMNQKSTDE